MPRKDYWVQVDCEFCPDNYRIRKKDFLRWDSTTQFICKECLKFMIRRYRKTGLWSAP